MLIYSDLLRTTCKKYQFNYPISLEGKGYGQGFKLCKSGLAWFDGEKGEWKDTAVNGHAWNTYWFI